MKTTSLTPHPRTTTIVLLASVGATILLATALGGWGQQTEIALLALLAFITGTRGVRTD